MEITVVGCGAVTAVGQGIDSLRAAIRANSSGLRSCARFKTPIYQSDILGAVPNGGLVDDPVFHLADLALREARAQAAATLDKFPPARIGFVLSTTKANIEALERLIDGRPCSESAQKHLQAHGLAADLAATHGAAGPVQTISLACVSGIVAIQQAAKLLQRDAVDAVLVVGVDCLSPFVAAGFSALRALDPLGCRPFDRDRNGLSLGESGAALVLARGHGEITICGWGGSNDANHLTGPARDGSGLVLAMRRALKAAKISPRDIGYVNAHGTGTPYNDAMESLALRSVFGDECPPVSASKGMLGHTLGAAGIVETIICILAAQEQLLPGTPRLTAPADGAPTQLLKEPRAATNLRHILKLGTGFGGVNAALVLRHG